MDVTLHDATPADLPVVKNLAPYYLYDLSEHLGWPCTPDGRFDGCDDLESYWRGPGKHAFVLRAGQEPAGFVLILAEHDEPDVDYSVTDFFVLRKFRGRGVGQRLAHELFDRFPGRWKVEQFAQNKPAVAFWRNVIDRYCLGDFQQRSGLAQSGPLNVLLFRTSECPGRFRDNSMTQHEWQACSNPEPMLRALPAEKYQRELRLFCTACVRRVWHMLPDACQRAIDVAEQFAQGTTSQADLRAAFDAAQPAIDALWSGGRSPDARAYATQAAGDAASPHPRRLAAVLSATNEAASAVACAAAEADDANYDTVFEAAHKTELAAQAALLRDLVPHPAAPPTT